MSAGAVRWGGITVFIGIALVIILPIVMVAMIGTAALQPGAANLGKLGTGYTVMSILMNLLLMAVIVYVFYATKGYFNALGYHRADIAIYLIMAIQVISAIVGSVMGTSAGLSGLMQAGSVRALGIAGIISVVTVLGFVVALLLFSIFAIKFGKIGGGVWTATGILYLIAVIGIIIGAIVIVAAAGFALGGGNVPRGAASGSIMAVVLIIIGALCYVAAIICHGIGLILGAGRMDREPNPVDAF